MPALTEQRSQSLNPGAYGSCCRFERRRYLPWLCKRRKPGSDPVAVVTEDPRLVLTWRGKEIVNISRAFLDTNGAHQETTVEVEIPNKEGNLFEDRPDVADVKAKWLETLADLNVCSQKGLVEMFDGSIGAGSVFMPYGGQYQLTETQSMVAKVPVQNGKTIL